MEGVKAPGDLAEELHRSRIRSGKRRATSYCEGEGEGEQRERWREKVSTRSDCKVRGHRKD